MRRAFLASLLALLPPAGIAGAQTVVDQQCTPEIWGLYSIPSGTPVGQEFVPAHGSLTFVSLWVVNGPGLPGDTARVFVVIHADSIDGAEVATSPSVHIAHPHDGEVRFDFGGVVALQPGRTHVIEARSVGPGNPLLAEGADLDVCPGVRGCFQGQGFSNGVDFWYRTGFDTTPVVRRSWGDLKLRYR